MKKSLIGLAAGLSLLLAGSALAANQSAAVTRATLDNGLRVVIVRDTLAPVVTTEMNYLAGADEVPQGFPGTAHAVEHMMFRGSPGLSKDQLLAIAANMGGSFNAATTEGVTQYYFTVPSGDLAVALHVAAIRMRGVDMTQADWDKERGAIEQEVARDNSNPLYKFYTQLREHMFAGTPYAWTGLGTRPSFNATSAADLKKFHAAWYAPNNAILVIAGDVDPAATLAQVKTLFGNIPRKPLPARPSYNFTPMQAKVIRLPTDLPVGAVAVAWRLPGLRDKDYATALVLADAMASKRGQLYAMGLTGQALFGDFQGNFMPHAGVGYAAAGFPRGGDSSKVLKRLEAIIADAATHGVPADLVTAAKNKAIADLEYQKNSVAGLANAWSEALAFRGGESPADIRAAITAVTPADVNALAKRVFDPAHAITAVLTPQSSGQPAATSKGFGGAESFGGKSAGAVALPAWATAAFAKLELPQLTTNPTAFTLANGLRVIVQPETVSKTVEVYGQVQTNQDLQSPKDQEGVADVLDSMFDFGTQHMNRLQFQAALDAISAHENAGASFSLLVPSANFAQGMELLAANELQPAIPEQAFKVMQRNQEGAVRGLNRSPGFLHAQHLNRALYPASDPIQRYATPKSVAQLTLADVKRYYAQTFRPDMTTIVIVGDVTPAAARQVVTAAFGAWQASGPKPDTHYPVVPGNPASEFRTPDSSAVQDSVTLAQTIPLNENSPDRYALALGNQILGGGFDAHLMQDLRVKHGLVYGVYSSISLQKHRGLFSVNYGSDPDKVAAARTLVIRDVKHMQTTPVTATELHAAKGKMLRSLALGQASFGSIASNFLGLSLAGKPLDADAIAARKYLAMTPQEIQNAFIQYVRPDAFVTAIKGPAAK